MIKHRRLLLALSLLTPCLSVACVSNKTLAANAVSYNLAVERAQNRMLFLNVIRASNRSPTYLTDVSKVTGSIKADVSASLAYMFGGSGNYKNSVTPGATYSLNPTFDVNVLSTQEFMRGFLQPLNNETLGYYLDQGWPPELLLHLLVREVRSRVPVDEETKEGKKFKRFQETDYDNYPDADDPNLCELYRFSRWIFESLLSRKDLRVRGMPSSVGGPVVGAGSLEALVEALKEGLTVKDLDEAGKYRLEKVERAFSLHVMEVPVSAAQAAPAPYLNTVPSGCMDKPEARVDLVEIRGDEEKRPSEEGNQSAVRREEKGEMRVEILGRPKEEITLVMRSPEAVMYYLGQLMRVEARGTVPEVCIQGRFQPIFFAQEKSGDCFSAVEADYEGTDYVIPSSPFLASQGAPDTERCIPGDFRVLKSAKCVQGRSMQALSLLSQLIALQKSAKDLPTTDVVRVVGQ